MGRMVACFGISTQLLLDTVLWDQFQTYGLFKGIVSSTGCTASGGRMIGK